MIDIDAATAFMATHARILDRHRLALLLGEDRRAALLAALAAFRNDDGGYGWGLEPDLRDPASQPLGALHAFEVLEEVGRDPDGLGPAACDWLARASLADGGLPFVVPGAGGPGTASLFAAADPQRSSLHATSAVCAQAHRLRPHDAAVAGHPWLARATDYCLRTIGAVREAGSAYELRYALWFLDAVHDVEPAAGAELHRLAGLLPPSAELPVQGGLPDECLGALDFAPLAGRPLRALVPAAAVDEALDRLAAGQQADGGWTVDFRPASPASALEWRGHATVGAVALLRANGRLAPTGG